MSKMTRLGVFIVCIGIITTIVVGLIHGNMRGYEVAITYPIESLVIPGIEMIAGFILVYKGNKRDN